MPVDNEIGGASRKAGKKRELVPYADTRSDSKTRAIEAFDEEEEKSYVPGSFDQYKHRGIESGYRDEYYTTKLDTSKISGQADLVSGLYPWPVLVEPKPWPNPFRRRSAGNL